MKKCEFCGEEFEPNTPWQKYCKRDHTRICPVCNKEYVEKRSENLSKPPVACSYACRQILSKKTVLQKYKSQSYFSSEDFRKKSIQTMLQKYGQPYSMVSSEIRSNASNSIFNRYSSNNKISRESIDRIFYEDDKYLVFQSKDNYLIENIDIMNFIQSINKIPVLVYKDEDPSKVLGQMELNSYAKIDSNDLIVYKLTKEVVHEFLSDNDYRPIPEGVVLSLGLVRNQTIYQVIVFGVNKHNKEYKLQLLRICNKCDYIVEGGLDKLSSVASRQFEICKCIAYQDQSKSFMNSQFESIGMKFLKHNHGKKIIRGDQQIYDCGTNVYVFE